MADGSDAGDLKDAIVAKLRLDAAPNRVRLLLEVGGGGAPVPLDSSEKLAGQGVLEGSKVVVEVMKPAPTALPTPVTFAEETVGGELMMVASLPHTHHAEAPFYLTPLEHFGLMRFLREPCSTAPQMLMLTGPIKSGKSRIVHDVLPRMLAARYAAAPTTVRRPVIFRHTFALGAAGDAAAESLVGRLMECAQKEGVTLYKPLTSSLDAIPYVAAELAQGVHRAGGELWLLFDELGAPIVASTPAGASVFTQQLKTLVELCSFYARTVGTGSGMVALLTAIRAALPNGFVLWDAITHVSLGREPAPHAALAIAEGIVAAYSAKWPPAVARAITPQVVLAQLALNAHGQCTSPRPALVAYLASLMGDACAGSSPEVLLAAAVRTLLFKLRNESASDTAVALERMSVQQRKALRELAVFGFLPDAHKDEATADFVSLLCEASTPLRLLPPYGALVRSWVAVDGTHAIHRDGSRLAMPVLLNLRALHTYEENIPVATRVAVSKAALVMLAKNGVGVDLLGHAQRVREPRTLEELSLIPAVRAILGMLDIEAKARKTGEHESPSSVQLSKALRAPPGSIARKKFMSTAGFSILLWIRHEEAHTFFVNDELPRAGLSSAVVQEVVKAALAVIVRDCSPLGFSLDDMGVLTRSRADNPRPTGGGAKRRWDL